MKIIIVCNSNLCRSPIAAGILKNLLSDVDVVVESAGFEAFNINDCPDVQAVELAKFIGVDISDHSMRLLSKNDFIEADRIYVMDTHDYRTAIDFAENDEQVLKVDYLMNTVDPGSNNSIIEPFNRNIENCQKALNKINEACEAIAKEIRVKLAS